MQVFWQIAISNSLLVIVLAAGAALAERIWKNASCLHLLWVLVLLKLVTPPLATFSLPSYDEDVMSMCMSEGSGGRFEAARQTDAESTAEVQPEPEFSPKYAGLVELLARESAVATLVATTARCLDAFAWIWGAGIVVFGWSYFSRVSRFRRLLRSSLPPSAAVQEMAQVVTSRIGLRRVPTVRMLPVCVSPFVWPAGLRGIVFLPSALFRQLDRTAQEAIIAHELAHVRRKDHWVRLLESAVTVLFWWHPIAWWAAYRLRELEDQCCDGMVVGVTPRADVYATALLDTLDFLSDPPATVPLAVAAATSARCMAKRIAMLKSGFPSRRATLGQLTLLLCLAAVPMAVALGHKPNDDELRQSARKLRDIMSALHLYHDVAGHFPSARYGWGFDKKTGQGYQNRPYVSWRVLLLPLLGEKDLFEKFRTDEPWDSAHNRKLIPLMPAIYRTPGSKAGEGKTNYLGACGANAAFSEKGSLNTLEFDGTTQTIMIVEVPDEAAVDWTRPEDFPVDADVPVHRLVGLRAGGFLTAFADGAPQFISQDIAPEFLETFFIRKGQKPAANNPIDFPNFSQDFNRWLHFVPPAAQN